MKRLFLMICATVAMFAMNDTVWAQEENGDEKLSVSVDVASGFVWRGLANNMAPVVQPSITFKPGKFSIGTWASIPFVFESPFETPQELDIFAEYEISSEFKIGITDYFVYANWREDDYYFNYEKEKTCHALDLMLMYESVGGFKAMLSTIIAGGDLKVDSKGKATNNFSTYLELGYGSTFNKVDWDVCLGTVFNESPEFYETSGFSVVNIGLGVSKNFVITPTYTLPLSLKFTVNPRLESAFLVASVTLF